MRGGMTIGMTAVEPADAIPVSVWCIWRHQDSHAAERAEGLGDDQAAASVVRYEYAGRFGG